MTDEYFKLLEQPCSILDSVENFIPHAKWEWVPYMNVCWNFDFIRDEICQTDPFLNAARKELGGSLQLYKFPAKTFYTWHEDSEIGCSLNMILQKYESHTMFSTDFQNDNLHSIEMLDYIPKRWYAFNSQRKHAVSNFGNEDRCLFTMTFSKPFSYPKLLAWCQEYSQTHQV